MGLFWFHFCLRPQHGVNCSHAKKDDARPSSICRKIVSTGILHHLAQPQGVERVGKVRSQERISSKKVIIVLNPTPHLPSGRMRSCSPFLKLVSEALEEWQEMLTTCACLRGTVWGVGVWNKSTGWKEITHGSGPEDSVRDGIAPPPTAGQRSKV